MGRKATAFAWKAALPERILHSSRKFPERRTAGIVEDAGPYDPWRSLVREGAESTQTEGEGLGLTRALGCGRLDVGKTRSRDVAKKPESDMKELWRNQFEQRAIGLEVRHDLRQGLALSLRQLNRQEDSDGRVDSRF